MQVINDITMTDTTQHMCDAPMHIPGVFLVPMLAKAVRVIAKPVLAFWRIMYTQCTAHFRWTGQA